mmetsp:Transcript_47011/g.142681  ORF Transcript_47011/g.142681 Transcript_47011/m.142681 type:complete len:248 (+) Transcript_47011:856-1599(+)
MPLPTGHVLVHCHIAQAARGVVEEPDDVPAIPLPQAVPEEEPLHLLGELRHGRDGRDEPAVAHLALQQVAGVNAVEETPLAVAQQAPWDPLRFAVGQRQGPLAWAVDRGAAVRELGVDEEARGPAEVGLRLLHRHLLHPFWVPTGLLGRARAGLGADAEGHHGTCGQALRDEPGPQRGVVEDVEPVGAVAGVPLEAGAPHVQALLHVAALPRPDGALILPRPHHEPLPRHGRRAARAPARGSGREGP